MTDPDCYIHIFAADLTTLGSSQLACLSERCTLPTQAVKSVRVEVRFCQSTLSSRLRCKDSLCMTAEPTDFVQATLTDQVILRGRYRTLPVGLYGWRLAPQEQVQAPTNFHTNTWLLKFLFTLASLGSRVAVVRWPPALSTAHSGQAGSMLHSFRAVGLPAHCPAGAQVAGAAAPKAFEFSLDTTLNQQPFRADSLPGARDLVPYAELPPFVEQALAAALPAWGTVQALPGRMRSQPLDPEVAKVSHATLSCIT